MNNSYISKLFVLTFLVTSCGGGGGGSSNSNTGSGGNNYTPPVINSFTSSEYSIVSGNSVTLSWSSSNASTCAAQEAGEALNLLMVAKLLFYLTLAHMNIYLLAGFCWNR